MTKKIIFVMGCVVLTLMISAQRFSSAKASSPAPEPTPVPDEWALVEEQAVVQSADPAETDIEAAVAAESLNQDYAEIIDPLTGESIEHESVSVITDEPANAWFKEDVRALNTSIRFRSGFQMSSGTGLTFELSNALQVARDSASRVKAKDTIAYVQFSYPMHSQRLEELRSLGATILDPIDSNVFFVSLPPTAEEKLNQLVAENKIISAGLVPNEAKLDAGLSDQAEILAAGFTPESVGLYVLLHQEPTAEQEERLASILRIQEKSIGPVIIFDGFAPQSSASALAELPFVKWVELKRPYYSFNMEGGMAISGDIVRGSGSAYDGTGVNVMVVDSGIARSGSTYHPDLPVNRILDQYDFYSNDSVPAGTDSHGTHVAGTIGGEYNSSNNDSIRKNQGMAPDVDFYVYRLCCNVPNGTGYSTTMFQNALNRATSGTRKPHISNNSWGGDNNIYSASSEVTDRAMRGEYNSDRINMVMASGNDNDLVSHPGTAKNSITVGAVKDGNSAPVSFTSSCTFTNWAPAQWACFSNYGPLDIDDDGRTRVKPDLVAPGVRITSPTAWYLPNDGYYGTWNGTSMAAPHVSGAIAQVMDAKIPTFENRPDAIKAIMLATAIQPGGSTSTYGHGMPNPYNAIYDISNVADTTSWSSSIASNETKTYSFSMPSNYDEVRVALTWGDPAGSDNVIHDLDLRVYDGDGNLVGFSTSFDDTVEYVVIPSGHVAGTWEASVRAYSTSGTQALGLSVSRRLAASSVAVSTNTEFFQSTTAIEPGDRFYLHQYISNSGFSTVGTYARLEVPDGFTVLGARLYTHDPDDYSYYYDESEIYHVSGSNYWRISVGQTVKNYTDHIRWFIEADGTQSNAVHSFQTIVYWQNEGSLSSTAADSESVAVVRIPTSVSASDRTYSDRIRVSWQPILGATSYRVYRASSLFGTPVLIGSTTQSSYSDYNVPMADTTYYYSVKACVSSYCGSHSSSNAGEMRNGLFIYLPSITR